MAVRDNVSKNFVDLAMNAAIGTNTTTNSEIIDTADYDAGIFFAFASTIFDDGNFAISFEEGDASNLSDAAAVPADKIIGTVADITALTADGAAMGRAGLFSTKRYVRAVVTSTTIAGTGATIVATVIKSAEMYPLAAS